MDFSAFAEWGYIGMFLAGLLAGTIVPFSSEVVMVSLYVVGFKAVPLLIVASIGNWIGGMTTYWVGLQGKTDWLEKYFGVKKEKIINFKERLNKWGSYWALLSWVPIAGNLITAALGFFRVPITPVATFMMIGKVIRYAIILYLSYESMQLNTAQF
jgi:membrane protein YqaA with SNARE-associated domain